MQEVGMFLVTSTSAPGTFRMETSGRTKNKE